LGVYGFDRACGILRRSEDSVPYSVAKRIMAQKGLKGCHLRHDALGSL